MAKLQESVWEYLQPLLKISQILNENTSPYFHSASLVIRPLSMQISQLELGPPVDIFSIVLHMNGSVNNNGV